jgi:poly(3-hydroxybutyrate) depolymerase
VPSPACAGTALVPGPNGNQTIMANGKNRTFIIRMANGYDGKRPFPIMFAFHGAGGGAAGFESGTFSALSKMAADKAIRIFPQAFGGNTWSRDEPDDVQFMDAIIQWLGTKVCYDTARVFATGQSSGSYFSHRFACDRGNVLRAVATSSGGQRMERTLDCKIPVSAWLSTGAADNPGHVMGTRQARDVWLKLAGCSLTGATPTSPAPCVAYPGCREGYAVHYCENRGGHAFPSYGATGIYNFLFNSNM